MPPLFLGTPEEQRDQAKEMDHASARAVTRLALTPGHLRDLAALLAQTAARLETMGAEDDDD